MQVIDVPVFNPDGSVQFTQKVSPAEAQALLQFALNIMAATGYTALTTEEEIPTKLDD